MPAAYGYFGPMAFGFFLLYLFVAHVCLYYMAERRHHARHDFTDAYRATVGHPHRRREHVYRIKQHHRREQFWFDQTVIGFILFHVAGVAVAFGASCLVVHFAG